MNEQTKCLVKDCTNHKHEGLFIGLLCYPCNTFISGDGGLYSQAYRNSRNMIDLAVKMEREACAVICEKLVIEGSSMYGGICANVLRGDTDDYS